MKKLIILIISFLIYTILINNIGFITNCDICIIKFLQNSLKDIPVEIPLAADCKLYSILIVIPLFTGLIFFIKKKLYTDLIIFLTSPLAAYICNIVIKNIIQRPRPLIELQIAVQPSTYSYVSSHTLITATLWGLVIYYLNKYSNCKILKSTVTLFGITWVIFEGLSRVWLGVHNPTDVIGAYLLSAVLLYFYVKLIKFIGGRCKNIL